MGGAHGYIRWEITKRRKERKRAKEKMEMMMMNYGKSREWTGGNEEGGGRGAETIFDSRER